MTIPRSPRSLRRLSDSRIADMVRSYALMMTKGELPADFGLTILHKARRIDAETRREIEAMAGRGAGEAAGAHGGDFPPADTSEQACPSGGPLRRSTGYA